MKRNWLDDELIANFTITIKERELLATRTDCNQLGLMVLLQYFIYEGRFPEMKIDIPKAVITFIAKQLKIKSCLFWEYKLDSKTIKNHKAIIRDFMGFKEASLDYIEPVTDLFINKHVCTDKEKVKEDLYIHFKQKKLEPFTDQRMERLAITICSRSENNLIDEKYSLLTRSMKNSIDKLISSNTEESFLQKLKTDPGRVSLQSVFDEVEKLDEINQAGLPTNMFSDFSMNQIKKYRNRINSETLHEIRRHPKRIRYFLLSLFLWSRRREILDNLIELLNQIIHKISVRAERKVDREYLADFKKVKGKNAVFSKIADSALQNPEELIKDAIYPIATPELLHNILKDLNHQGATYREKVFTVMKSSYSKHYRRMVPEILRVLEFKSNNISHQPIIDALALVKTKHNLKKKYMTFTETIPFEGVIKPSWREIVLENDEKKGKIIDKIKYEILVLKALRSKLRCKEVWVVGADRYRNPDEDLPMDFYQKKQYYYDLLKLDMCPETFIHNLKDEMKNALLHLNNGIPLNAKVSIGEKNKGWITVSPSEPQQESENILNIKNSIYENWKNTSLLDTLKETDLRTSFTNIFKSTAIRESLSREIIQKRLMLTLYALGTNTGVKRIAVGNEDNENYQDLIYIKRKFINKDNLRQAIVHISNEIFKVRMENLWGIGTSCASDSKKFGAWDQNLMTEWHIRYRGRGVMIYWHVDKKSTCIYSQLKTCSSSEVASMIEGVLKHCTDMSVDKNYVDSHGQSEVAFAFSHLLGFQLMPRIKRIHSQKLYLPESDLIENLTNLKPVCRRSINWNLISEQYDEMVKYVSALKHGSADTESILKRFTRNNATHPTYKAFSELGKAVKTIFLCNYLSDESMRIEVNEGLNVVENWNSANSFIFFGKSGEIASNDIEQQEISILALHLLQNCMIYINTLMFQEVIIQNDLLDTLNEDDLRAITPLVYSHINPYGTFKLDMTKRIPLVG